MRVFISHPHGRQGPTPGLSYGVLVTLIVAFFAALLALAAGVFLTEPELFARAAITAPALF